jgi:hypothetical protein
MAEIVVIGFEPTLGHARPAGLAFSCWNAASGGSHLHVNASRSAQVCAGQIEAS